MLAPATAQNWAELTPGGRTHHAMCAAPGGGVLMFGGSDNQDYSALGGTLVFDGTDWLPRVADPSIAPPARYGHAMVLDLVRNRVVLFGGQTARSQVPNAARLDDTWEFDGVWHRVATVVAPQPRADHAMAFDLWRARTVLFGGIAGSVSGGTFDGTTWEYDGSNWSARATALSPGPRARHSMAHDIWRGNILLYGGADSNGVRPETWSFDGLDWRRVATAHSPSPTGTSMVFQWNGRMLLYSSEAGGTWSFDGSDWTQVAALGPRPGAVLAYDHLRDRKILFGGGPNGVGRAETWEFDGTAWQPAGNPLPGAWAAGVQAAHDPLLRRTVVLGTSEANATMTWTYDGAHWTRLFTAGVPLGFNHALAFDGRRGGVVCFDPAAVTWEFTGSDWNRIVTPVTPPARNHHAMAFDARRGRIVLFGGVQGALFRTDTWTFDGANWSQVATTAAPPGRIGAGMAYDIARDRTVLFAGGQGTSPLVPLDDTYEFDGAAWVPIAASPRPSPRAFFGMTYDAMRACVVITSIVGASSQLFVPDTWEYDGTWHPRPTVTSPPQGAAVWLRSKCATFDATTGTVLLVGTGLWRLTPPPVATASRGGPGCAGNGATAPVLTPVAGSLPALGTSFQMELTGLPAQPGGAVLAFGAIAAWNGVALPVALSFLGADCQLWISPDFSVPLTHGGLRLTVPAAIPNVPELAGIVLGVQCAPVDASGLVGLSNAINLRLL